MRHAHLTPKTMPWDSGGHGRGRRCADEDYREEDAWPCLKNPPAECVDEAWRESVNVDNQQVIGMQGLDYKLFQTVFVFHSQFFIVKACRESGNENSFITVFPIHIVIGLSQECGLLHAGSCILPTWYWRQEASEGLVFGWSQDSPGVRELLDYPFGGIKQCKSMVIWNDFPHNGPSFGLVM